MAGAEMAVESTASSIRNRWLCRAGFERNDDAISDGLHRRANKVVESMAGRSG